MSEASSRASGMSTQPAARRRKRNIARHAIGYVARHIRRSAVKSLLSVGLALLLAGTVGMLTVIRATNETAYESVQIKAHILGGITITPAIQLSNFDLASSSYYESIIYIESNSVKTKIVLTNDINRYNADPAEIEFLDGYTYEALCKLSTMPNNICVMDSDLMETLGVGLGDKVRISDETTRVTLAKQYLVPPAEDEEGQAAQMEKFESALDYASVFLTVVGSKTPGRNANNTVYVPISSGRDSIVRFAKDPLDFVEYALVSPSCIDDFRDLAETKIIGAISGIGSPFVMDTSEADNIDRMLQMLSAFYPIAIAAEAVLGGLFPGLIIMQSARDAAMMRALGTPKRRTRAILIMEQAVLCLLGLILAAVLLFVIGGPAIAKLAASLAAIGALHLAACVIGALICAVVVTMRRPLELLQVKE